MVFSKVFLQKGRWAKCINRYLIELWNFTIAIVLNLLCWILILKDYQSIATGKCFALQMYIRNSMNVNYCIHTKFSIQWNISLFCLHKCFLLKCFKELQIFTLTPNCNTITLLSCWKDVMTLLLNLLIEKKVTTVFFFFNFKDISTYLSIENLVHIHRSCCLYITRYDERVLLLAGAKGKIKMPQNVWNLKNMYSSFIWQGKFVKLSIVLINHIPSPYHVVSFPLSYIISLAL